MGILSDWMIERDVKIEPFAPQENRPGVISYGVTSYGYDVRVGYKFKVFSPINAKVIDPKCFDPNCLVEIDLTPCHVWRWGVIDNKTTVVCSRCDKERANDGSDYKEVCPKTSCQDHILIPPHSFALAESFETFTIPRDVLCVVLGKSTYARCGLIVNVTPGEPEWTGKWTVELSNTTPLPMKVYAGEGIMQCIFLRTDYTDLLIRDVKKIYEEIGKPVDEEFVNQLLREQGCRTSYADKKGKYQAQTGLTLPKVEGDQT